jgi:hypothetical protein
MKKIQIFIIILLFLITIIFYNYFNIQLESFSLLNSAKTTPSTTTSNTTTKEDIKEDEFNYFKIVPEYNRFSDETREALKKKLLEMDKNLTNHLIEMYILRFENYGSEEESNIFIKTGEFPINNYMKQNIKNFWKNEKDSTEEQKEYAYKAWSDKISGKVFDVTLGPASYSLFDFFTQGMVNNMYDDEMVGQVKFMKKSRHLGIDLPDKGKFNCRFIRDNNGKLNIVPYINDMVIDKDNYITLEKAIPGFKFLQQPCDPCTNRCPFSYEGVIAAPYARYWGINSQTGKATPEEV